MKEFQEKMVGRMEAVEKKVELVEKVEGPMADRVVEIAQKEIGEDSRVRTKNTPNITITSIRKLRNKDVAVVTLGSREEKYEVKLAA